MTESIQDVVIAGGSLAGFISAREISKFGHSVTVLEEHNEIGNPEKCDGLVSINALSSLGLLPKKNTIQNKIIGARLFSPSGVKIDIDSSNLDIVVLDRKKFDIELYENALSDGAVVYKSSRFLECNNYENHFIISSSTGRYHCKYFVDAMGTASFVKRQKSGILQAAKYIVEANWFEPNKVDLYFNQKLSPGFFTWVIPINEHLAKVGIAGYGINSFDNLNYFLKNRPCKIIKKIACPIIVSGPLENFVNDDMIFVGDSAGQTKPSTAGGIYSGGMGGLFAGQSIHKSLITKKNYLLQYEENWKKLFSNEFKSTSRFRKIFNKLDNNQLDEMFNILSSSPSFQSSINKIGDFDFHSFTLIQSLGIKKITKMFGIVSNNELRKLFNN